MLKDHYGTLASQIDYVIDPIKSHDTKDNTSIGEWLLKVTNKEF